MANIKITDLNNFADPNSTDVLPIVDVANDETKKVSIGNLMKSAVAGTAALPGVAFAVDEDTGMYRNASDQLAFATGGTQRILIDDSGVVTIAGDLTVNGTTTTIDSTTLTVEDKNIELGVVDTPTDTTADGGGITLKGATDKTLNWVNSSDSWTSSENVDLASGKTYKINGTDVLSATALGSAVQISSDNIPSGTIVNDDVNASAAIAGTKISPDFGAQDLTVDTDVLHVDATNDRVGVGTSAPGSIVDIRQTQTGGETQLRIFNTDNSDTDTQTASIGLSPDSRAGATAGIEAIKVNTDFSTNAGRDVALALNTTLNNGKNQAVYITHAGNVGIGTTSPGAPLEVESSEDILIRAESTDQFAHIDLVDSAATSRFTTDGATGTLRLRADNGNAVDSSTIQFEIDGSTHAVIDSSGRLLVGTPSEIVSGTADSSVHLVDGGGGKIYMMRDDSGSTVAGNDLGMLRFYSNDGGAQESARIEAEADLDHGTDDKPGRLVFSTTADGESSPTERMRISANGNITVDTDTFFVDAVNDRVGVGTSSPSTVLHVADTDGAITFEGTRGTGATHNITTGGANSQNLILNVDDELYLDANDIVFRSASDSEYARFDSSGRLLVGTVSAKAVGSPTQSLLQVESSNPASFSRQSADTAGPIVSFAKSRGTPTDAVQNDDAIASIRFAGSDGTDMEARCAEIGVRVDGTVASNSIPGEMYFATTAVSGSSPTQHLLIRSDGTFQFNSSAELGTVSSTGTLKLYGGATNHGGQIDLTGGSTDNGVIKFRTGSGTGEQDEKARIDSSGRLLVGRSDNVITESTLETFRDTSNTVGIYSSNATTGNFAKIVFAPANNVVGSQIICEAEEDFSTSANRTSRLEFWTRENGTLAERMRIQSNGKIRLINGNTIFSGDSGRCGILFSSLTAWLPTNTAGNLTDNDCSVGASSYRMSVVYAGTGTINTSDINLKQDIENLGAAELSVATAIKSLVKKYRFKDAAEKKGDDARIHVGVIAQEVEQAFIAEGLDPRRYALFCEDTLEDGSKRLGVRYNELLAFVIAAL